MMLYCKTDDEYFKQLGNHKAHEFRQIEGIIIENKLTGETKQFPVKNIFMLDPFRTERVKRNYPKVPWDDKPVFAIELGDEIVSVQVPDAAVNSRQDRTNIEKRWCAVGD